MIEKEKDLRGREVSEKEKGLSERDEVEGGKGVREERERNEYVSEKELLFDEVCESTGQGPHTVVDDRGNLMAKEPFQLRKKEKQSPIEKMQERSQIPCH